MIEKIVIGVLFGVSVVMSAMYFVLGINTFPACMCLMIIACVMGLTDTLSKIMGELNEKRDVAPVSLLRQKCYCIEKVLGDWVIMQGEVTGVYASHSVDNVPLYRITVTTNGGSKLNYLSTERGVRLFMNKKNAKRALKKMR